MKDLLWSFQFTDLLDGTFKKTVLNMKKNGLNITEFLKVLTIHVNSYLSSLYSMEKLYNFKVSLNQIMDYFQDKLY